MSGTVLDALVDRLGSRSAAGAAESRPAAVLWPDEARHWERLIPALRHRVPVVTLGDYAPDLSTGPAYWVRCVADGLIDLALPKATLVVYLPGYARTDIRAVEDADESLKPLAELLYRGTTFAQPSGRDWTIVAFLESEVHGLGVRVADDRATKEAVLRASVELAGASVDDLRRAAPLKAAFFNALIAPDLDREVLRWLDDREAFELSHTPEQIAAFRSEFAEKFSADLDQGEIALARLLGLGGGRWAQVWARYAEAPSLHPNVERLLAAARPERSGTSSTLFEGAWGRWPQDNAEDEDRLRVALKTLGGKPPDDARAEISALEAQHAARRAWVWATLGRAPLAFALEHLARLATTTKSVDAPASARDAATSYASGGWRVDDAVIRALGVVKTEMDRGAVSAAIRAVYGRWLEETAIRFQAAVGSDAGGYTVTALPEWPPRTCLVFFDGLRLDIARHVEKTLHDHGMEATLQPRLTALPTLTATAKPAASPIASLLRPGKAFAPTALDRNADLGISGLRSLLAAEGWQTLALAETGDTTGRGWTELGDLDEIGHLEPWNLPEQVDREVEKLVERIGVLLSAGWDQVVVVTDHGWLYLPGGLPKVDFPTSVTTDDRGRKGRTARLADDAHAPGATVPWFWDPSVRMAVAPGIATFVGGAVYEHGGVSPQECVTPLVTVRRGGAAHGPVTITIEWRGLRALILARGAPAASLIDIRRKAGNGGTTIIGGPEPLDANGSARTMVPDSDHEGTLAFVVVVSPDGKLLGQEQVTVGG